MNKRELIIAELSAHVMTTSATYRGGIRQWKRHCFNCGAHLPWNAWEELLIEHQADVLVERLGL